MKKIFYLSGSRADYGPIAKTLYKLENNNTVELNLLFIEFSKDLNPWFEHEIEKYEEVKSLHIPCDGKHRDELAEVAVSLTSYLSDFLISNRPELVLILGDRFEQMLLANLCFSIGIEIAHVHGGEKSGSIDDKYRDCISKFSSLHFVSCEKARERLISCELATIENVSVVGAPGLEEIQNFRPTKTGQPQSNEEFALFMFHPDVQNIQETREYIEQAIQALLMKVKRIYCILGNFDPGSSTVRDFFLSHKELDHRILCMEHLDRSSYLNLLSEAKLFVGNSSSGIIESASLETPFLNLGGRQTGRFRNDSTFDWSIDDEKDLISLIDECLKYHGKWKNIYFQENTSDQIVKLLLNHLS